MVYMGVRHRAIVIDNFRRRRTGLVGWSIVNPAIRTERVVGDVCGVVKGRIEAIEGREGWPRE
jgi:hypothetical protein